jgi:uncharacterized protein YneF (UPF0154 family)
MVLIDEKKISPKFQIWQSLLDNSLLFALAGLKAQGFSEKEAFLLIKKRWEKEIEEHHQVNEKMLRKLYGKRGKSG